MRGVISVCLSRIFISMRCFRSRFIIDAHTSSRFAQFNSGNGHKRATFGSLAPPSLDPVGTDDPVDTAAVEVDG